MKYMESNVVQATSTHHALITSTKIPMKPIRDSSFITEISQTAQIFSPNRQIQPDEIYNLGAQSHVAVSFEEPEYTANCDGLGTLRILEAVRLLAWRKNSYLSSQHK